MLLTPVNIVRIALIFVGIIFLWFVLGFLMPYVLNSLAYSGQFGDTFGSVNALFSGLGLGALVFTILLQIEIFNEQKSKERTDTAFRLMIELKEAFDNFEFDKEKGFSAFDRLRLLSKGGMAKIDSGAFNSSLIYLESVIDLLASILNHFESLKLLPHDKHIVSQRIKVLVHGTLFRVYNACEGQMIKSEILLRIIRKIAELPDL